MQVYKVGGAVRDKLLGLQLKDIDYVVVGSSVDEMLTLGFHSVGKDFPVFLHPQSGEEYALARTERKTAQGYHGFQFNTDSSISLEQDLSRRDLTINAIAEDEKGQLIDPFNGQHDIKNRVLRHVSAAFAEDPLRVLRVARFASRFHSLGFTIAPETIDLMRDIVQQKELHALTPERIWKEISNALLEPDADVFFSTLRECNALNIILPEIERLFGVPQTEKWHPEIDTGIHTLMVLQMACRITQEMPKDQQLAIRFAALVHDLGKGLTPKQEWPKHHQHENRGLAPVKAICKRLKIPRQITEFALLVTEYHLNYHRIDEMRSATIVKFFNQIDAFRRAERFQWFVQCCEADSRGRKGMHEHIPEQTQLCLNFFAQSQSVGFQDVQQLGLKGKAITQALNELRINALEQYRKNL